MKNESETFYPILFENDRPGALNDLDDFVESRVRPRGHRSADLSGEKLTGPVRRNTIVGTRDKFKILKIITLEPAYKLK